MACRILGRHLSAFGKRLTNIRYKGGTFFSWMKAELSSRLLSQVRTSTGHKLKAAGHSHQTWRASRKVCRPGRQHSAHSISAWHSLAVSRLSRRWGGTTKEPDSLQYEERIQFSMQLWAPRYKSKVPCRPVSEWKGAERPNVCSASVCCVSLPN